MRAFLRYHLRVFVDTKHKTHLADDVVINAKLPVKTDSN